MSEREIVFAGICSRMFTAQPLHFPFSHPTSFCLRHSSIFSTPLAYAQLEVNIPPTDAMSLSNATVEQAQCNC